MAADSGARRWWRDVAAVSGGSAVAQFLPIVASIVLTRLVVPGEYGEFAAWLGVVTIAGVFIPMRLESAIALEPPGGARQRALLCVLLIIGVITALLAAIVLVAEFVHVGPGVPGGVAALGLATAGMLAASTALQTWLGAEGVFGQLSRMRIVQALALSGTQVVACWVRPSSESLMAGYAFGTSMGIAYAMCVPLRRSLASDGGHWSLRATANFVTRHRRFALLSLPAGIVGSVAEQLPLLLTTARFGSESAGYLALAQRTLGAGIALLTAPIVDVFRRDCSNAWVARGECGKEFAHSLRVLAAMALALVLVVAPAAPGLFAALFGSSWRQSGVMAIWLLPLFAMRTVASPLSFVYFVAGRQGLDLAWQLAVLSFIGAAFLLPHTAHESIVIYAWGYAGLYAGYLLAARWLSTGHDVHGAARDPGSR